MNTLLTKSTLKKSLAITSLGAVCISTVLLAGEAAGISYRTWCVTENNKILCTGSEQNCLQVGKEHVFQTGHTTQTGKVN